MQFSIAKHQTSKPISVRAGSSVSVAPEAGATALVEYTSGSVANIADGSATWAAWMYGAVSSVTRDFCASAVHLRVTSEGGAVTVDVHVAADEPGAPTVAFDSTSGNVSGLIGPDVLIRKFGSRRVKKALVCGDSITAYAETFLGLSLDATTQKYIVDNGDGTVTCYRASHGLSIGQIVRIWAAPSVDLNLMEAPVTAILDANSFKVAKTGRTHNVTGSISGASTCISIPLRRSCNGWWGWLEGRIKEPLDTTWCAVPGATSADILALLQATPLSEVADLGTLCIGMNDVYKMSWSQVAAWTSIQALMDALRTRCNHMLVYTIPPRHSSDAQWTTGRQTIHTALNRQIYDYAKQIGAVCLQTAALAQGGATYINGAATNPDPDTTFLRASDNTHPSVRGAMAMGFAGGDAAAPWMGTNGWKAAHPSMIGSDAGNLIASATFPTATSGVATGWVQEAITNGTVTSTIEARTVAADGDACGFNQRIDLAYGTATGTPNPRFRKNAIQALVTPGKTIQFRLPIKVTGAVDLRSIEVALFGTLADGTSWQVYGQGVDGSTKSIFGDFDGVLFTPPAVVPANLTNLDMWLRPTIGSGQTATLTIRCWQPDLRNIN